MRPRAVGANLHEALQPNLADAGGHAAGLDWCTARAQRIVAAFDAWIAADAFFAGTRCASVERLLVRTTLDAFAVAAAALLVDEHDAVLRPLVDRLPWTGSQAAGVRTMVADSR